MLGHYSWKRNRRPILLLSQVVFVCCFLFLLINAFHNNRKLKRTTGRSETIQYERVTLKTNLLESESPICTGNLLSGGEYNYEKWARGFYGSRLVSASGSCRLLYYTAERIVTCLDSFHDQPNHFGLPHQYIKNIRTRQHKILHFVFIGDSRIRQQFFNFVKLIPDYDKKSQPSPVPFMYHGDIEVASNILRLRVSFQWRPIINSTVTETIRQWTISNLNDERPDLIFLSMALHHMQQIHSVEDYTRLYQEKIIEFAPILDQLGKFSQVIWFNQHPTMELNKPTSEMVHIYNKNIRRVFKNHHNIRIWDSSNPLVEEYIRSCAVLERKISESFWEALDYATPYINCYDNLHPGYSALSQATQLLFNNICNN